MQAAPVVPNKPKLSKENWLLLTSLYITISLPLGFFIVALIAILRQKGTPMEQLSVIYFASVFWALKFLWAPIIDKWRFGFLGHYRGWLILIQLTLIVTLLLLSKIDVVADFSSLVLIAMIVGFLSASLDAVANALAFRLLPSEDRGLANSIQSSGILFGNLFGGGIVLMLYPIIGWEGCVYLLVAGISVSFILSLRYKEVAFDFKHPSVAESIKRYISFWKRKKGLHWFVFLAMYPLGISVAWPLITPMLVDVQWQLDDIGFVVNVIGSAIGIVGAMLAGWLIQHYGRRNAVFLTLCMQIPSILLMILITHGYTDYLSVMLIVSALLFGYSPVMAVIYTLMMDHASEEHPATDIAIQYSLFNIFAMFASVIATAMVGYYGYQPVLITAALITLLALIVSYKYPFNEFNNKEHPR